MKGDSIPIYRTPFRSDLWKWWIIHKINVFRMLKILYSIRMMKCIFLGFFCKEDRNMDSHCTCTFDSYIKHFFNANASFVSCFPPLCSLQSNRIMVVDFAGRCTASECWYIWSSIYWVQHPTISNLLQKQTRKTYENKYICHKVFSLSEVRQKW